MVEVRCGQKWEGEYLKLEGKQCAIFDILLFSNSYFALSSQKEQKCQFRAKFGGIGQKILIFTGAIKSFVTHITKNPPRHLVHIVFWSGIGQKVQKMAIFGPK